MRILFGMIRYCMITPWIHQQETIKFQPNHNENNQTWNLQKCLNDVEEMTNDEMW